MIETPRSLQGEEMEAAEAVEEWIQHLREVHVDNERVYRKGRSER